MLALAGISNLCAQPFTIPTVVHVLHNNGVENISDLQVLDGVGIMNDLFSNAFGSDVPPPFDVLVADAQIQFCLATTAPDGSPTNGIDRIDVGPGFVGGPVSSFIGQWPPERYLNIWVVPEIQDQPFINSALNPAEAELTPAADGVMIRHSYFGTIGTSAPFNWGVIAPLLGRYFNLLLLWELSTGTGGCGDDEVSDTPPCQMIVNCAENQPSCTPGVQANRWDYMTYSYCGRMFTPGQRDRMHACLQSPIAMRSNLWSDANLGQTGCGLVTAANETKTTESVQIFPNPAMDHLMITGLLPEAGSVEVLDITGRVILSRNVPPTHSGQFVVTLPTIQNHLHTIVRVKQPGHNMSIPVLISGE